MWHGSDRTATCVPVAPVSTRSRRNEARDDHDLRTRREQSQFNAKDKIQDENETQSDQKTSNVHSQAT